MLHIAPPCTGTAITPGTLTAAQYTQSFSYDNQDRLRSSPLGSYSYDDPAHLHAATFVDSGTDDYSADYDAAGNMTARAPSESLPQQKLSWDNEGRLTAWQNAPSSPTSTAQYLYDGEGNRVEQQTTTGGGTTNTTVYLGNLESVSTSGATTTTTTYYYAAGQRIALAVNGTLSYLASDLLGSATVALDGSGLPLASQLYAPYGGVRYSNGTMPTDYGFTGQHADNATGLDYYGARYYDPTLGQFTSADTMLDGLNRYAYVGGNPTTLTDPSGNRACTDACGPAVSSLSPAQWQQFYAVAALTMPGAALTMALWSPDAWHQALAYAFAHPNEMPNGNAYTLYLALGSEAQDYRNSRSADYWNSSASMMEEGWELTSMMVNSLQAMHAGNGANDSGQNLAMTAFPTLLGPRISDGYGNDIPLSRPLDDGGSPSTDGTCSFSADTAVATPNGQEQAIGTLQVGDKVEAYDPTTGQSSVQTVQHVWVHQDHDLLDVTLLSDTTTKAATSAGTYTARPHRVQNRADSDNNDNSDDPDSAAKPSTAVETVHTTTNHPWLTADRGWLPAGDLRPGEQVIQLDGSVATVAAVRVVPGMATMYNLTVSNLHSFAVGDNQFVVHNTCGGTKGPAQAAPGGGGGSGGGTTSGQPGDYLSQKAPQFGDPNSTRNGIYVNDIGQVQPWQAHYDQFGRIIARTDYNATSVRDKRNAFNRDMMRFTTTRQSLNGGIVHEYTRCGGLVLFGRYVLAGV